MTSDDLQGVLQALVTNVPQACGTATAVCRASHHQVIDRLRPKAHQLPAHPAYPTNDSPRGAQPPSADRSTLLGKEQCPATQGPDAQDHPCPNPKTPCAQGARSSSPAPPLLPSMRFPPAKQHTTQPHPIMHDKHIPQHQPQSMSPRSHRLPIAIRAPTHTPT